MVARNDTIAAIATAPGRGGVAVIRVSGPDAFVVAERLTNKKPQVGRVQFVSFRGTDDRRQAPADPGGPLILDEGLLLSFKAPHSYTGEDVVEFQCHGGTVTPQRILAACLAAGARLARRGEFTERAFLNGKLALDQAESVLDLIDAKTERAADVALKGLTGQRDREAQTLYEQAIDISSEVEHALDIDEGELPESFLTSLAARVEELKDSLRSALVRAREGKILREGALVVLAGPPNAGKSSLMNALLGEHRAIVSEVAGTTRDSIEEWLDLDGWPVRLVDTAASRQNCLNMFFSPRCVFDYSKSKTVRRVTHYNPTRADALNCPRRLLTFRRKSARRDGPGDLPSRRRRIQRRESRTRDAAHCRAGRDRPQVRQT